MTTTDYAEMAAGYRRDAAKARRDARKHAEQAGREYRFTRQTLAHAAWLMRRPDLWDADHDPAAYERYAATSRRLADTLLRSSFGDTDRARFYSGLARRYDTLRAERGY